MRPEKIRLREPAEDVPAGLNQLHGVVRDASYLGVCTSTSSRPGAAARVTVYEQNVERATRAELWEPGEEVVLTWSPDHTFAVEGGGAPPPDVVTGRGRRTQRGAAAPVAAVARHLPARVPDRRRGRRRRRRRGVPRGHVGRQQAADRDPAAVDRPRADARAACRPRRRPPRPARAPRRPDADGPAQLRQLGRLHRPHDRARARRQAGHGRRRVRPAVADARRVRAPSTASRSTTRTPVDENESFMGTITPAAVGRPRHRLGPDRPDRLDGVARRRRRMGREDRPRQHADRRRQRPRRARRTRPGIRTSTTTSRGSRSRPASATTSQSTQRDLTKIADLFDPAFAGKVTLLSDPHDSFPLIHLMLQAQGKASATPAEAMTVGGRPGRPRLPQAVRRQRRTSAGFTGNAYLQGLRQRRHLGGLRLVRRPRLVGRRGRPVRLPRRGLDDRDRQHDHPEGRAA